MKLTEFKALSFDCYGTLIDWEQGILAALTTLRARSVHNWPNEEVLQAFARHETLEELEHPEMRYPELLSRVYRRLGEDLGLAFNPNEGSEFGTSIAQWPEFPDSIQSLKYLKQHYKLFILSNVDRASFRFSNERLQTGFDGVYTAEDAHSYKPSFRNFQFMLDRIREEFEVSPVDILHVAQSLFHDHVPAKKIGLASAWIDRRHGRRGWGATMGPSVTPACDFKFNSMMAFVEAHLRELTLTRDRSTPVTGK